MAIEKEIFRQVMGRFATGVTVVTTSHDGQIGGITVNSFTSVSLNPPLVLICIDNHSNTLTLLRESQKFAVNMLTEDQRHLSQGFATNTQERFEHFCHASYHTAATGAPIIDDVLAFIDARVIAEYPGGDHTIFIGQVEAMGTAGKVTFMDDEGRERSTLTDYNGTHPGTEPEPLLYYKGKYQQLATPFSVPKAVSHQQEPVEEPTRG